MSVSLTTTHPTLVAVPDARTRVAWVAMLVLAGIALIGLSAQVRIQVPPSPVPITGQTLAVLLIGAAYGARLGGATVLAYLAVCIAGVPIFTGWNAGWAYFVGSTGGYLVGFVFAAVLVGALAERGWDRTPWLVVASMVLGNLVIYVLGVLWLQQIVLPEGSAIGWGRVWSFGVAPYLVGDAFKIALAAGVLPAAWWLKGRAR
ncbi:MAG: biotin transporter BioY [Dehalococcoidia bacterium]